MPPSITYWRLFVVARCFYPVRVRHRFYNIYYFRLLHHEGVDLNAIISSLISLSLRRGDVLSVAVEAQSFDAPQITTGILFIHGIWKSRCFVLPTHGGVVLGAVLSVIAAEGFASLFID